MNKRMKAAQVGKPGGAWELVERDIPKPAAGQVRVKVEACGICHSDTLVKEGLWPGLQYPRVPGHEIAGRIDAIGADITQWKEGDRVGVGWHGGHDLVCDRCRRGDFAMCVNRKVTGIDFDGGYAEFLIAPVEALAAIPDDLPAEEAGPFMCAGVTVYNALRNSGRRPRSRQRQGNLGQKTGSAPVHRFRCSRHCGRTAKTRRRARDSGDSAKRKSHLCCGRGPGREWESAGAGRAR